MAAPIAYLLKEGFRPANGLDRRSSTELWHVTGITGWNPSNTVDTVFAYVGAGLGKANTDPALSSAICTNMQLVAGPFISLVDGSMEAIVAVTYDSNRRWGAASFFEGGTYGEDYNLIVPSFCRVALTGTTQSIFNYIRNDFSYRRGVITRIENRIATGIGENGRAEILRPVGQLFNLYGLPWIYQSPQLIKLPTNAVLLKYRFWTKTPVPAFPHNDTTRAIDIPALNFLEEYQVDIHDPLDPKIRVVPLTDLFPTVVQNPGDLPFWNNRA